jgi:hypothetical protein
MPRLTNREFLKRHHFLAQLWENELLQVLFSSLEPMAQWRLHQYYQTVSLGTDDETLETRQTVNAGDSALPQQAGKAYSELVQTYLLLGEYHGALINKSDLAASIPVLEKIRKDVRAQKPAVQKERTSTGKGSHRVQALMKPGIDMHQLVKALIKLAEHQLKQKKAGD